MSFRDSRALLLQTFLHIVSRALAITCTLFAWAIWRWWGIEYGPGLRVRGWALVRRKPGSSIVIGPRCTFVSARSANIAGINRPCHICTLQPGAQLIIGAGSGFSGTVIGAGVSIVIGKNVLCGANTTITDTDWHHIPVSKRQDNESIPCAPISIGNDVWLGMNVVVLKGVSIGDGTIVASNSVVTKDLPAGTICGGMPARVLRHLTAEELAGMGEDRSPRA